MAADEPTNVTPLTTRGEPNAQCVEFLEEQLERAKRGEIVGVAFVSTHSDLTASRSMAGLVGGSIMLGEHTLLGHEIAKMTLARYDR